MTWQPGNHFAHFRHQHKFNKSTGMSTAQISISLFVNRSHIVRPIFTEKWRSHDFFRGFFSTATFFFKTSITLVVCQIMPYGECHIPSNHRNGTILPSSILHERSHVCSKCFNWIIMRIIIPRFLMLNSPYVIPKKNSNYTFIEHILTFGNFWCNASPENRSHSIARKIHVCTFVLTFACAPYWKLFKRRRQTKSFVFNKIVR